MGRNAVERIYTVRLGRRAREEARAVARRLRRGELGMIVLEDPEQEVLSSVIVALISEGVSVFSADNVGATVRLYVVKRWPPNRG